MPPRVDSELCTSCGHCTEVCPGDILHLGERGVEIRYPAECSHCGVCKIECPVGAIDILFPWTMLQPPIQLTRRSEMPDA